MQGEDTLVSVPAGQPNLHWPADSLLAGPRAPTISDQMLNKPLPNYSIGSPLAAATISANDLPDSARADRCDDRTARALGALVPLGVSPVRRAEAVTEEARFLGPRTSAARDLAERPAAAGDGGILQHRHEALPLQILGGRDAAQFAERGIQVDQTDRAFATAPGCAAPGRR
jgi:hypothetical protein